VTCTLSPRLRRFVRRKRGERQYAFRLESDVEDDGVSGHGNHRAFTSLIAGFTLAGMSLLVFRKNIFE